MDTTSVHCMCVSDSNATDMNTCQGCLEFNLNQTVSIQVVLAWYNTCKADEQFNDQQAVACWEAQPMNYLPCVANTGGKVIANLPPGGLPTGKSSPTRWALEDIHEEVLFRVADLI